MAKKFYFLNSTISLWKRLVACNVLSVSGIINFSYIYVLKVLIIYILVLIFILAFIRYRRFATS